MSHGPHTHKNSKVHDILPKFWMCTKCATLRFWNLSCAERGNLSGNIPSRNSFQQWFRLAKMKIWLCWGSISMVKWCWMVPQEKWTWLIEKNTRCQRNYCHQKSSAESMADFRIVRCSKSKYHHHHLYQRQTDAKDKAYNYDFLSGKYIKYYFTE